MLENIPPDNERTPAPGGSHDHDDELIKLRAQLAEERKLFNAVLEQLPVAVAIGRPPDGRLVLGNDAFTKIWRKPFSFVEMSRYSSEWKAYFEDGRVVGEGDWPMSRALSGERIEGMILKIERGDATIGFTEQAASPVYDDEGMLIAGVITFTDITERRKFEEELKRTKEFAEAANDAKTRFLASMSHEIRTPMNSILGFTELLRDRDLSEDEKSSFLDRIRASGDHLLGLIDDLLDLSRIEIGQTKLQPSRECPLTILSELVKSLDPIAQKKGLELALVVEELPREVCTDALRFRQILTNMLSNSLKFTETGGVTVRARTEKLSRDLQGREVALVIDVDDTGIGIRESDQEKLFQPFTQADGSITRKFGGTGLGLSLSRRLARALGGELKLRWSEPGRGSSFELTLPVNTLETIEVYETQPPEAHLCAKKVSAPEPARDKALSGYTVLLVEDSSDNELLMRSYLKKSGAELDVAHNGVEAIEKARSGEFDVVLMDVQMPVMDGLEATRRLRALGYQKPILALTAHALGEEIQNSLRAGCNAHLSKPVDRQGLIKAIREFPAHVS